MERAFGLESVNTMGRNLGTANSQCDSELGCAGESEEPSLSSMVGGLS